MKYVYSNLDNKNRSNFKNNAHNSSLLGIKLTGQLRGLKSFNIEFEYPITVFAGKNGCGKSTILALAACAYHNRKNGYFFSTNRRNYYTFSDFFIQTVSEIKVEGIILRYQFLHHNWSNSLPGLGYQIMKKSKGGKWSKYEKRVKKNVVFLGIERVVPQSEKKIYKTKRKFFIDNAEKNSWYGDIAKHVGKILGKRYDSFKIHKAGNYNLQLVEENSVCYSGFNMGAGEKALFELFYIIYESTLNEDPVLIIIDEIELGLHEEAQRKLIDVLKSLCIPKKIQIICTTHSPTILEALPPEARFYIERSGGQTLITQGISSSYAAGRLAEKNSHELDIYVEDETASLILESILKMEQRQRVNILPIGSYNAVIRQLSASYKHPKLKDNSIVFIDGDKRSARQALISGMMKSLELSTPIEKTKFAEWIKDKVFFMPGDTWPEKWLLQSAFPFINSEFASSLGVRANVLKELVEQAIDAEKHSEFYTLGDLISIKDYDRLKQDFAKLIIQKKPTLFSSVLESIENKLH